jgi:hypothetical protein
LWLILSDYVSFPFQFEKKISVESSFPINITSPKWRGLSSLPGAGLDVPNGLRLWPQVTTGIT